MTLCELATPARCCPNGLRYCMCIGGERAPTTHEPAMTIIDIQGKGYEVHSVKPYFHAAGAIGNTVDIKGESLIVRQVRSKKFWLVHRYEDGSYSKLIA